MKIKRLDILPAFSWKTRATMFFGIFGGIWLFIDPFISLMGGTRILEKFGVWGYVGLLFISGLSTLLLEVIRKLNLRSHKIYITLTMIITQDGTRHLIQVPQDLRIDKFILLFLEYVSKLAAPNTTLAHHYMYNWNLQVRQRNESNEVNEKNAALPLSNSSMSQWNYIELPSEKTLADAGILNNDVCRLHGRIKDEYASELEAW